MNVESTSTTTNKMAKASEGLITPPVAQNSTGADGKSFKDEMQTNIKSQHLENRPMAQVMSSAELSQEAFSQIQQVVVQNVSEKTLDAKPQTLENIAEKMVNSVETLEQNVPEKLVSKAVESVQIQNTEKSANISQVVAQNVQQFVSNQSQEKTSLKQPEIANMIEKPALKTDVQTQLKNAEKPASKPIEQTHALNIEKQASTVVAPTQASNSDKAAIKNVEQNVTAAEPKVIAVEQKLPAVEQKSPAVEQKLSVAEQKIPTAEHKVSTVAQKDFIVEQKSPASEQKVVLQEQKNINPEQMSKNESVQNKIEAKVQPKSENAQIGFETQVQIQQILPQETKAQSKLQDNKTNLVSQIGKAEKVEKIEKIEVLSKVEELSTQIETLNNLKKVSSEKFGVDAIKSANKAEEKSEVTVKLKMNEDDIKFFLDLTTNQQMIAQASQGVNPAAPLENTITQIKSEATQQPVQVSAALLDALNQSSKTGNSVRIDFGNNIAVVMKLDKNGTISANFIPGDAAVENYLRNNISILQQNFDNKNLSYNELTYSKHQKQENNEQRKNNKEQENE